MNTSALYVQSDASRRLTPYVTLLLLTALALILMAVLGDAFAQTTPPAPAPAAGAAGAIGGIFNGPAQTLCGILTAAKDSLLFSVIAIGCIFIGAGLYLAKQRGAMEWAITGIIGFILLKQSFNIAKSFGIVTDGCVTTT